MSGWQDVFATSSTFLEVFSSDTDLSEDETANVFGQILSFVNDFSFDESILVLNDLGVLEDSSVLECFDDNVSDFDTHFDIFFDGMLCDFDETNDDFDDSLCDINDVLNDFEVTVDDFGETSDGTFGNFDPNFSDFTGTVEVFDKNFEVTVCDFEATVYEDTLRDFKDTWCDFKGLESDLEDILCSLAGKVAAFKWTAEDFEQSGSSWTFETVDNFEGGFDETLCDAL
jgi:hypothetical protein